MFELTAPTAATLKTLTPRTETHGDDKVSAISFGLKIVGSNTLLDRLQAGLREALYEGDDAQDPLPGVEPSTPKLRTRGIESVKLAACFEGWTLEVSAGGIDEDKTIIFGGCKVDNFVIEPAEGGSITLHMRIGTSDIDEQEAGWLFGHLQQSIEITLHAPKVAQEPPMPGGQAPTATDLFAAGEPAPSGEASISTRTERGRAATQKALAEGAAQN